MTSSPDRTAGLLDAVLADLSRVVGNITPAQLHDPTPCSEFDVAQLRDHVVGWLATFAAGFADPDGRAPRASLDGYVPPQDPAAEVRAAAATMGRALAAGAAARPLRLGEAAMPGDMALNMILWEYVVHGWDLARATGQPWSPPAGAAASRSPLGFPYRTPPLRWTGCSGCPGATPPGPPQAPGRTGARPDITQPAGPGSRGPPPWRSLPRAMTLPVWPRTRINPAGPAT